VLLIAILIGLTASSKPPQRVAGLPWIRPRCGWRRIRSAA